jgi:survival-of-motor-neuron-related-splicing factor 30
MSLEELKSYEYQLEQVSLAIEKDPENSELKKLSSDLEEIIGLLRIQVGDPKSAAPVAPIPEAPAPTTKALPSTSNISLQSISPNTSLLSPLHSLQPPPVKRSKRSTDFSVGKTVMARWSGDNQFYKAQIVSKGKDGLYSLEFSGYSTVELVHLNDIRDLNDPELERIMEKARMEKKKTKAKTYDKDKMKKKNSTKIADLGSKGVQTGKVEKPKSAEVVKQQAWLSFTKNAQNKSKKSKLLQSLTKKSMFASPEEPEGKVGVVNSGKPMTTFQQRGKHIYENAS